MAQIEIKHFCSRPAKAPHGSTCLIGVGISAMLSAYLVPNQIGKDLGRNDRTYGTTGTPATKAGWRKCAGTGEKKQSHEAVPGSVPGCHGLDFIGSNRCLGTAGRSDRCCYHLADCPAQCNPWLRAGIPHGTDTGNPPSTHGALCYRLPRWFLADASCQSTGTGRLGACRSRRQHSGRLRHPGSRRACRQ